MQDIILNQKIRFIEDAGGLLAASCGRGWLAR
jgi:hypothetical protein